MATRHREHMTAVEPDPQEDEPEAGGGRPGRSQLVRWFTPGLHIKRWLLLLFSSIVLISLGVGYALKDAYTSVHFPSFVGPLTLQFLPRGARAGLFALVGLLLLIFSFYMLGRALIGALPGGRSDRSLADQLYTNRRLSKGPRVVAVGGGTGLSTLLRGIKHHTGNISAIVTVADDGGSSGRLREEFRILPPGDFRQCLTALAETEPLMTKLFSHRFSGEGTLGGHSFGNLFIMAMAEITGDFEHALRESGRVLAVRGQIIPSTLRDVVLCARSGSEVRVGESRIPEGAGRIDRVFLQPENPPINPEAEAAILDAELIIIGPGSLYTSILPNLLVDGMVSALRATPAVKVYVCNVAGQPGETSGFSVAEHLDAIDAHIGGNVFDYIVVNNNQVPDLPASAAAAGINRVTFDSDRDRVGRRDVQWILADVVSEKISTHHDPTKLAAAIMAGAWS
jgi:uncharacterized cofD-like protein